MGPLNVLHSPRLRAAGFLHGFSTRVGGASEGPFASLNLGAAVGDDPARVRENHMRLAASVGYDAARLFQTSQVHGAAVFTVTERETPDGAKGREADALVTRVHGTAVGVRVADCVPVLLADTVRGNVAAVHAGWKGVVQGVIRQAIEALDARGESMIAAIGPSIGPCCFEVGDDVAVEIAEEAGDGIVLRRGDGRPHVDLWRAVEHQLWAAGVGVIDTLGRCTVCEPEWFYSYRRDGAQSGRMLGVIAHRG